MRCVCSAENTSPNDSGVGIRAERAHQADENVRGRHADLEPVRSAGVHDRAQVVVEAARAGVVEREPDETARLERLQDLAAGRAVERAAHVRRGIEHVRQRQDVREREGVVERGDVDARDVERAEAREVDGVGLAAELPGVVDADAQAAAGLALDDLRRSSAPPRRWDSRRRARPRR